MTHDFFSLPQMLGYATFLISMVTFSQKGDRRFKVWLIGQNLLYACHFYLMDNPAAMAGALLASVRNGLSLRTQALWVAVLLIAVNVLLGFAVVKAVWNVLPLLATAVTTLSMFRLPGTAAAAGSVLRHPAVACQQHPHRLHRRHRHGTGDRRHQLHHDCSGSIGTA